jgi:hypothetical protein
VRPARAYIPLPAGEEKKMKGFGIFLLIVGFLALFAPEIMALFAGLIAGGIGLAAGLFAGGVALFAGIFGVLLSMAIVVLIIAAPVIIFVLIILGIVHIFSAA